MPTTDYSDRVNKSWERGAVSSEVQIEQCLTCLGVGFYRKGELEPCTEGESGPWSCTGTPPTVDRHIHTHRTENITFATPLVGGKILFQFQHTTLDQNVTNLKLAKKG